LNTGLATVNPCPCGELGQKSWVNCAPYSGIHDGARTMHETAGRVATG